ncbi:MAG: HAD-IIB family hydrolase [Candidatus Micrarchaeaceae archaeon]|jgi:HAD superfamily hydrolase (TIGR01484 family)|nr:HAD-IIB family hydrolase [Candidatus Micrarchaeota archaeon]
MQPNFKEVRLVVADLDETLTKSKTAMDPEMSELISELLGYKAFAVISGGAYPQFQKQFVGSLKISAEKARRLYLLPTCATSMYIMKDGQWVSVYIEIIPNETKKEIFKAFDMALDEWGFKRPEKLYGELIEDRETQITFSAFGQLAPLELKVTWDPDSKKRLEIIKHLVKYLPKGYQAKIGGSTSIDVTREGIDKGYGIRKIEEKLGYKKGEMIFIGDKIFEGGNDYPVKATGVYCIQVADPEEAKGVIRQIIESSK